MTKHNERPEHADSPTRKDNGYLKIVATGFVSLLVGITSGLILNFLTNKPVSLEYEVVTSEVFTGPSRNIAILNVAVRNLGKKEIEDLKVQVELKDATLTEHRVLGIPAAAYAASTQKPNMLVIDIPYFNPAEATSVQMLVDLATEKFDSPSIEVRAKGVTGKLKEPSDMQEEGTRTSRLVVTTAFMAVLPMLMWTYVRVRKSGLIYTTSHSDDQRDVFAFVLSINGLFEDAASARGASRNCSYWGLADLVTERALQSGDNEYRRRAIKALNDVQEYAAISSTSCLLINYDIARLAVAIGDDNMAKEHLAKALKGKHKVIEKRIALESGLRAIGEAITKGVR